MRLERKRVRTERWYSVGWSPVLKKYVLSTAVGYLAVYERFFEITEGEYLSSYIDPQGLDELANMLFRSADRSSRFICSQRKQENDEAQNELCRQLNDDSREYYSEHPEAENEFERF